MQNNIEKTIIPLIFRKKGVLCMRKKSDVNMEQIARLSGVSISTVSRVMNNTMQISQKTTQKVIQVAHSLQYSNASKWKEIALIYPDNMAMAIYSLNIVNALNLRAIKYKMRLIAFHTEALETIDSRIISGSISFFDSPSAVKKFSSIFNIPLVCINAPSMHLNNIYATSSDEEQGMKTIFNYLLRRGHRKIGFLLTGGFEGFTNRRRQLAFQEYCSIYNIEEKLFYWLGYIPAKKAQSQLRSILDSGITALIVNAENDGLKILLMLQSMGVSIPGDISLVTWDFPGYSAYLSPPLTAIGQDYNQLADSALDLLDKLIKKEKVSKDVLVPYHFYIRRSVCSQKNK